MLVEFLRRLLPEHFDLEARGGYLADALAVAPQLSDRAEKLRQQHGVLARQIVELAEHAGSAGDEASEWEAIAQHVRQFAGALLRHEHAEGLLTQEAFTDDLGTSG